MSDTYGYLFRGEEVVLIVRPHGVVLLKPSLAPLAALALLAAAPNRFTVIVVLLMALRFAWDVALWWVDRYVLTTERIISLSGILTTKVASMPLSKLTDLTYSRTLLGRIVGYGSLDLESAGQQQGLEHIDFLPDPDDFYRAVMALALGGPGEADHATEAATPPPSHWAEEHEVIHLDDAPAERDAPDDRARPEEHTTQLPAVRRSDD